MQLPYQKEKHSSCGECCRGKWEKPFRFVCMILVVCQHETGDTAHWPPLVIRNLCERLVPSLESPHLSSSPWQPAVLHPNSGAITSGLSHSEHPIGTPQVTSGEGGSITLPYFWMVTQTICITFSPFEAIVAKSSGESSLSLSINIISKLRLIVKFFYEKKASLERNRTSPEYRSSRPFLLVIWLRRSVT